MRHRVCVRRRRCCHHWLPQFSRRLHRPHHLHTASKSRSFARHLHYRASRSDRRIYRRRSFRSATKKSDRATSLVQPRQPSNQALKPSESLNSNRMTHESNQRQLYHLDQHQDLDGALLPRQGWLVKGEHAWPKVPRNTRTSPQSRPACASRH